MTVLQDWLLPPVDLWAVFPAGRQASVKARAFVSFIQLEMLNATPDTKERPSERNLWNCGGPMGQAQRESARTADGMASNILASAA